MNTKRIRASFELFSLLEVRRRLARCLRFDVELSVERECNLSINDGEKERKGKEEERKRWTQCCETRVILSSVTSIIFSRFVV